MKPLLSTYSEFSDHSTAEHAVRALKASGFDNIEIEDLSHGLQMSTDTSGPPLKQALRFSLTGVVLGSIFGLVWGLLVFGVPITVLNVPFSAVIALIGLSLCIVVGGVIGLEQAFVFAGRISPDPTSALGNHAVGVRVSAEAGSQVVRAREILNRFNEEPTPAESRWWRLRQWAHHIGT